MHLGPESPPTPSNALAPAVADRPAAIELDGLDCYRVSLEFQNLVTAILGKTRGELRSQLDRAALSITLNIAEGRGRAERWAVIDDLIERRTRAHCGERVTYSIVEL